MTKGERKKMKINNLIKSPLFKKSIAIVMAIGAGIAATADAIAEQKRDEEFEELKQTVSELQNQDK
jgi:hypothetical protein